MKRASIDFSHRVTEGSGSLRLQTLRNQLNDHFPYIRYTNSKYYFSVYSYFEFVNQSQMNARVEL